MGSRKCPEWLRPEVPNVLSAAPFKLYRERLESHQHAVKAARPETEFKEISKEVDHLESLASTHQKTRKFKHKEADKQIRKENSQLVQKLCEVAKRRPEQATMDDPSVSRTLAFESLREPIRRKEANDINLQNEGLLRRLESARPAVVSNTQADKDYARHRETVARTSRFKRSVHAKVPPPMPRHPARPPGEPSHRRKRPRGKYDDDGPLYCPDQSLAQVKLKPLENRPLPDGMDELPAARLTGELATAFIDHLTSEAARAMLAESLEEPWEVASVEPRSNSWSRESGTQTALTDVDPLPTKAHGEYVENSRGSMIETLPGGCAADDARKNSKDKERSRGPSKEGESEPSWERPVESGTAPSSRDRMGESGTGPFWFPTPDADIENSDNRDAKKSAAQKSKEESKSSKKEEEDDEDEGFEDYEESREEWCEASASKDDVYSDDHEEYDEEEEESVKQPETQKKAANKVEPAAKKPAPAPTKSAPAATKAAAAPKKSAPAASKAAPSPKKPAPAAAKAAPAVSKAAPSPKKQAPAAAKAAPASTKAAPAATKPAQAPSKKPAEDDDEEEAYGSDEFATMDDAEYEEDEFEAKSDEDAFESESDEEEE